ncbi:MAG: VCBS repeat-containing protein [Acidobacteriales bacterium]|nr:VCBS repeat-containing protein [Terriglobales bacterium]
MPGKADGSFSAAINFPAQLYAQSLTAADLNGDGKADLALVGTAPSNSLLVLLNTSF